MDKEGDTEKAVVNPTTSHWTRNLSHFLCQTDISEEVFNDLSPLQVN